MAKARKLGFDQLPSDAQRALFDSGNAVDQETLLRELVDAFGGPKEIARTVSAEFKNAGPGSITRQRILEMLTRLVTQVSDSASLTMKRASDMTDEELEKEALRYYEVALVAWQAKAGQGPGGPGDGTEADIGDETPSGGAQATAP